jgi:hypothetical protein
VNCFKGNLIQPWHCLLRRLAWPLGLLHHSRKSLKSRWSTRSRQSRCWRSIRFIPRPRLEWTYPSVTWFPCQLWGQPSKSVCSRWNKCSKWAIERVIKFFVFLTNSQGEEAFVVDHIHEWDNHWKVVYASFEEGLNLNEDLYKFSGRMSYVLDDNHWLQAWMPYISRVHPHDLS